MSKYQIVYVKVHSEIVYMSKVNRVYMSMFPRPNQLEDLVAYDCVYAPERLFDLL